MRGLAIVSALGAACGGGTDHDRRDAASAIDAPAADAARFDPGPEPTAPIQPRPGELTIIQLALPIGATLRLGEAAILVGPDGTIALVDVGNSSHADEVLAAVHELNTTALTPARGFPPRAANQVEWVILTHFHGDHIGGFEELVAGNDPIAITRGVVYRGWVDVGAAMNTSDFEATCDQLTGPLAAVDTPLCTGPVLAPCRAADFMSAYPASACPGLFVGDLASPGDDASGAPTFLDLGAGARLTLVAADGHVSNGTAAVIAPPFGHDASNTENARSLAGVVSMGDFRYHFGGDLTGLGTADEPDVESLIASEAVPHLYGALGVDVTHVHHHARDTSSNAAFVDALAPADGRSRNVVAGTNAAYIGSPQQAVLDAWLGLGRLGTGRFWVTARASGGGAHAGLVDANGPVIVQTIDGGIGYRVQAAGSVVMSMPFESVR